MGFDKLHKSIVDLKNGFLEKLNSLYIVCQNIPSSINSKIGELKTSIGNWFDGVITWFSNLNTNIGTWFDNVKSWITTVNTSIWDGIKKIGEWFGNVIKSIGEWFTSLISNLGEWFKSFGVWIAELPQKIADLFKELFIFLFVPEDNPFLAFKDLITSKFPIVNQIKELTDLLLGFSYGDEPIFTFTYNDMEFPIIDLTPFNKYKVIINSIIVAICYFMFFMKLIKMLPSLIRGL